MWSICIEIKTSLSKDNSWVLRFLSGKLMVSLFDLSPVCWTLWFDECFSISSSFLICRCFDDWLWNYSLCLKSSSTLYPISFDLITDETPTMLPILKLSDSRFTLASWIRSLKCSRSCDHRFDKTNRFVKRFDQQIFWTDILS